MFRFIDSILNKITMYRLVLYFLILLVLAAAVLGFFGLVPYSPVSIIFSTIYITLVCWIINTIFAWAFNAPTNIESVYITALILALIITPFTTPDLHYLIFVFWASVWAVASKFILAINKKHIFNPAAFAVVLTTFTISQSASWWVGTASMLPFVLVGGILLVRKIKRFDLLFGFLITTTAVILGLTMLSGGDFIMSAQRLFVNSPVLFFAFVMLTEPLTTPPTKLLQTIYGVLVGFLFVPQIHLGAFYTTPELALVIGNVFSYAVSPKQKLLLGLGQRSQKSKDIYDFIFKSKEKLKFAPGQYLEWTLEHPKSDSRGNRRYFTIASSPTEKELIMGVKFYDKPSSFKKALISMQQGSRIVAAQLSGDFTLPKDKKQKLVFIAGGIGVTPFRSMIKYLIDLNEPRDIVLFFSNKEESEIVYKDIFDMAEKQLGIRTIYVVTDKTGYLNKEKIVAEVPDFAQRTYYISGPHSMVTAFEDTLNSMGIPSNHIKIDFFPGFA